MERFVFYPLSVFERGEDARAGGDLPPPALFFLLFLVLYKALEHKISFLFFFTS